MVENNVAIFIYEVLLAKNIWRILLKKHVLCLYIDQNYDKLERSGRENSELA